MARQVQLSDEAYARLAALRKTGESFSDVVLRLPRPRKDPRTFAGLGLLERSGRATESPQGRSRTSEAGREHERSARGTSADDRER